MSRGFCFSRWRRRLPGGIFVCALFWASAHIQAAPRQMVDGHLADAVKHQAPLGRLAPDTTLEVTFALPLRDREKLTNYLHDLYHLGSPGYHHFLKPAEFQAAFGPTAHDYGALADFARAHGLSIVKTHANRTLLHVRGKVRDLEGALHVKMNYYRHPKENRVFYSADAQPSIDLDLPVLAVSGLHDYILPHPCLQPGGSRSQPRPGALTGSGPNGTFLGGDFRTAYAPDVAQTGAGQAVALFELDGYDPNDITNYINLEGATNAPPLENVLVDGFSGGTGFNGGDAEVCLDIEMVIAMAPGLSRVLVYEGNVSTDDILNQIAVDDAANQISSSWLFDIDAATEQIFQQYAAQGQSFFQAAGDYDAYTSGAVSPSDDPNVTSVGGTLLSTTGPLGAWTSETVWNRGNGVGTGGGSSVIVPIPSWQQGVSMASNGGSMTMRNLPDVAMVADDIWVTVNGSQSSYGGTSVATPLWAAFAALVNEQAAENGAPPLGFANPAIYNVGLGANYQNCFHDIVAGDNTSPSSPNGFFAAPGYDLCTGWGTPAGSNLVNALLAPADSLVIRPQLGFTALGPIGGPFNVTAQTYLLTNCGNVPLDWSAGVDAPWLTVSPASGALAPGGASALVVSLNAAATNLLLGNFSGTCAITNLQDNVAQSWPFALDIGNGGFETGDFTNWNFSGEEANCYPVAYDDSLYPGGGDPLPGVPYSAFAHSGRWGAFLGQNGSLGSLSHPVPTGATNYYLLSFWLADYAYNAETSPNEFAVEWNGATLFDQTNLPALDWTNLRYLVQGIDGNSSLLFNFRDDPGAIALDDVQVQAMPAPVFQSVSATPTAVVFTWAAWPGLSYQLQYTTDLTSTNWNNLGSPIAAATNIITTSDVNPPDPQRFYRFLVSP